MQKIELVPTYRHGSVEEADRTLNELLDVIVEGTWDWDAETGLVRRSPGWFRMLGYPVGELAADVFTWEQVIHPDDYARVMAHFEDFIQGRVEAYSIRYRCRKADGDYLWIQDRAKIVERQDDGQVRRLIGAHLNIHEQLGAEEALREKNRILEAGNLSLERIVKETNEQLRAKNQQLEQKIREIERLSNTDVLTGVANRKFGQQQLEHEIKRSDRYGHPLSFCLFDIDFFKQINDQYGHRVGDLVLQNVSKLFVEHIRDMDLLARWGGEEFILIFPNLNLTSAVNATEKLRGLLADPALEMEPRVSCSFGVTQYRSGQDSADDLIHRADRLMYQAKQAGRNRVETGAG